MSTLDVRIEYNVNDPDDAFEIVIVYEIILITYAGLILETMCLIFFVYNFSKKTKAFCSNYFYLLVLGYIVNIFTIIVNSVGVYSYSEFIESLNELARWYMALFLGPWNACLALNRFTAMVFWRQHKFIWSKTSFAFILVFIIFYPFIVNGFIIIEDLDCFLDSHEQECLVVEQQLQISELISNGINVMISAILSSTCALCLKFKLIKFSQDTKKMESHLLLQSLLSSIFFGVYCICDVAIDFLHNHEDDLHLQNSKLMFIFASFSQFYYIYFHISSTLLLFCLSDTVRESFIEFYHLRGLFKSGRRRRCRPMISFSTTHQTKVHAIMVI